MSRPLDSADVEHPAIVALLDALEAWQLEHPEEPIAEAAGRLLSVTFPDGLDVGALVRSFYRFRQPSGYTSRLGSPEVTWTDGSAPADVLEACTSHGVDASPAPAVTLTAQRS